MTLTLFTERKLPCSPTGSYHINHLKLSFYTKNKFFLMCTVLIQYRKKIFSYLCIFSIEQFLVIVLDSICCLIKSALANLHSSYIIRKKVQKYINWNHCHYICALYYQILQEIKKLTTARFFNKCFPKPFHA